MTSNASVIAPPAPGSALWPLLAVQPLEASRVAPLEYSSFIWAAGLGFVFFGEVPTPTTAMSALLIFGGCVCLLRR